MLFDESYRRFLHLNHPLLGIDATTDGLAYFSSEIPCHEVVPPGILRTLLEKASPFFTFLRPHALAFGLPFEPYEQSPLLGHLPSLDKMKALATSRSSSLIFIGNVDPASEHIPKLCKNGFYLIPSFPDMVLAINFSSFEDYLSQLSRRYRYRIRHHIEIFITEGYSLSLNPPPTAVLADECYQAYTSFRERAKVPWIAYESLYFHRFAELKDASTIVAYAKNGQFSGMAQMIKEGPKLHIARLATARDFYRKGAIFFRLLYACIELGIKEGCEEISFAPTSYRAKKRLGAKPRPLVNLLYPMSPAWKSLMLVLGEQGFSFFLRHLSSIKTLEEMY